MNILEYRVIKFLANIYSGEYINIGVIIYDNEKKIMSNRLIDENILIKLDISPNMSNSFKHIINETIDIKSLSNCYRFVFSNIHYVQYKENIISEIFDKYIYIGKMI